MRYLEGTSYCLFSLFPFLDLTVTGSCCNFPGCGVCNPAPLQRHGTSGQRLISSVKTEEIWATGAWRAGQFTSPWAGPMGRVQAGLQELGGRSCRQPRTARPLQSPRAPRGHRWGSLLVSPGNRTDVRQRPKMHMQNAGGPWRARWSVTTLPGWGFWFNQEVRLPWADNPCRFTGVWLSHPPALPRAASPCEDTALKTELKARCGPENGPFPALYWLTIPFHGLPWVTFTVIYNLTSSLGII